MATTYFKRGIHRGGYRGFIVGSESLPALYRTRQEMDEDLVDWITVGVYYKGGGTTGEFELELHRTKDGSWWQLCAADNVGFVALAAFRDVIEWLSLHGERADEAPSVERMKAVLIGMGIVEEGEK